MPVARASPRCVFPRASRNSVHIPDCEHACCTGATLSGTITSSWHSALHTRQVPGSVDIRYLATCCSSRVWFEGVGSAWPPTVPWDIGAFFRGSLCALMHCAFHGIVLQGAFRCEAVILQSWRLLLLFDGGERYRFFQSLSRFLDDALLHGCFMTFCDSSIISLLN